MSTPAYVKKLLGVTGGSTKLYRDRIMDAGFLGHFDFVSAYCNGGVTSGAAGSTFTNLVDGGDPATVSTAVANGITSHGLDFGGGGLVALPGSAFKFGTGETHFAVGLTVTPNPAPGNSKTTSFAGYAFQTSSQVQWLFSTATNSSGVYTYARFTANALAAAQTSNLGWLTDGKPHFLVGEFEVVGSTFFVRFYVDGVLVASNSGAYTGSLVQPTDATTITKGPLLGTLQGFTSGISGKAGRIWSKRWAIGGASITASDIAKRAYAYYGPAGAAAAMFGSGYASVLTGPVDANRYG